MAARDLCIFFKWGPSLAPSLAKKQVNRFLVPQSSVCFESVYIHTKIPARKDAPLANPQVSEGAEAIDLDKWKTVMRLKAAPKAIVQMDDEDEDEDEASDEKTDGNLSLEATRELVTMWRQAGKLVPQEMTDEELQNLAGLPTKSSRKKYLKYLAIKEGHKKARKEKQQKKRESRETLFEQNGEPDTDGDDQKEFKNTFLLQFWNRSLDKLLAWKSAQAMIFGQPLVFDMSYEANMSKREIENTVSQLMEVEAWNRRAIEPYHLHLCNLQSDSYYKEQLLKRYGPEAWDRLFITSTDQQHLQLFPKEDLVYLTADSPNVLRTYDHSKVYIIGALVDRSIQSGLSLANAKRLKLATARLPLDEFLHWDIGAKNLTLDQMIRIMLTLKETGKWTEALRFVPTRKHDGFHPQQKHLAKTFKSGTMSVNESWPNRELKPTVNRLKTVKSCGERGKPAASRNTNWWDEN